MPTQKDIGYYIKCIHEKLKLRADADLKSYHLTQVQGRVLAFLNSRGGKATQKEIELFLEVSHPTVVGIVSRMEQNGHVITWMDETDRRNKIVSLTKAAEEIGEGIEQKILKNEQRMVASLSNEDIDHLRKTLKIISKNLE